jgi:pimeloyl-ACP methyl ester carboxylesterase
VARGPITTLLAAVCLVLPGLASGAEPKDARHLIYLHGRIVQDQQDRRPRHPEWGYYELDQILQAFRERGFVVSGEVRPKDRSLSDSADVVVEQVRGLVAAGVPLERISVVGGSMGGAIALLASLRLQLPELRLVVLGACMSETVPLLVRDHGKPPAGRILSFRDTSDETSEPCPAWSAGDARPGLLLREIVLSTGLHHGFLFRPLPGWVDPTVRWAETGQN